MHKLFSITSVIAVGLFGAVCLAQDAAGQADNASGATAPGLQVRLYELEQSVAFVPELADGQLPNVVKVVPTLDLNTEVKAGGDVGHGGPTLQGASDFGGLTSDFLTEVVGFVRAAEAGEYTFQLISDDGAKLWIDGKLVVDHDGLHGPDPKDGKVQLTAGRHELKVLHFQGGGGGQLTLQWWPAGAVHDGFVPVPADVLSHATNPEIRTAAGKKKIIPPLRRGRPGDGTPRGEATHAGFTFAIRRAEQKDPAHGWISSGRLAPMEARALSKPPVAWLPCDTGAARYEDAITLPSGAYAGQVVASPPAVGEGKRVFLDRSTGENNPQGSVFRFASVWIRPHSSESGAGVQITAASTGKAVFEMLAVRAVNTGFEIEFTKPLDRRCGWDPESYYIEQWPFNIEKGKAPRRDGIVYPVKAAAVSSDRKKVYLEIPNLKTSHVVYIRLLPPCVSAEGELPWSTEAWYTLNAIPQDRVGPTFSLGVPLPQTPQNILTDQEQQQGWKLLFDGRTPQGWRGWKKDAFPAGWQVKDGCLMFAADRTRPGGDICTEQEFDNFELQIEWRIAPAGNSGIFFRADEQFDWCWRTAPECQVLDNAEHVDGRRAETSAASNYALYAPSKDATQPIGFFNQAKLVVNGNHVEHWLNGEKVVEYELGSPEWEARVKASKFASMPDYGRRAKGRIVLQDHGDRVWYRNIKIRELK
ncbi:MAG: family 16 glycoside hydrolase [Planctomycetota bacterium]